MKITTLALAALFLSAAAMADDATVTPANPVVTPGTQPADPVELPPPPPLLSCTVEGKDISKDDVAIVSAINAQEVCWQAVHIANACSSGVINDLAFITPAAAKCNAELNEQSPTASDLQQLKVMRAACNAKWAAKAKNNSIYASTLGLCQLNALEWVVELTSQNRR